MRTAAAPRQTRPMPENTVDQIDAGPEFDELAPRASVGQEGSGLLDSLASLLGISPAKIATALGAVTPGKSKLNATCRCGKRYKYFSDDAYTEDQSTCPACRDEAMSVEREQAMRPEKIQAQKRMREEEAKLIETKEQNQRETVELVARTVAELLPQLQKDAK